MANWHCLFFAKIPFVNEWTGKIISFLIAQMDGIIERTDRIPYSVTDNIHIGLAQTILLYFTICYFAFWLLTKKTKAFITGLTFLLFVFALYGFNQMQIQQQHKLIIYNIPKQPAMDIIDRNKYVFIGDHTLSGNSFSFPLPSKTVPCRVCCYRNRLTI